jgi:uridine kinase
MKQKLVPRGGRLVAIVGGSGAGKTWLASQLQMGLGKESARLCLDQFYRDRSHLTAAQRARLNFDHPRSIDWPWLEEVLGHCSRGTPTWAPRYDFTSHQRVSKGDWWHPKPLVIVEGLWLLHRPALRRLFSFRIFVDCPENIRLERRLQRDTVERGRTPESVRKQFRDTVVPMHERFVQPQARWADVRLSEAISPIDLQELIERLRTLVAK